MLFIVGFARDRKQKYDDEKYNIDFVKRSDIYIDCIINKNIRDVNQIIENIPLALCGKAYHDNLSELVDLDFKKLHSLGVFKSSHYVGENILDYEEVIDTKDKVKEVNKEVIRQPKGRRKAKFLLFTIATLNVILKYPDYVVLQVILGIMLFSGNNIIRYLYIVSSALGIIVAIYLSYYFYGTSIIEDLYLLSTLCLAIFSLIVLIFSKEIKEYVNYRENKKTQRFTVLGVIVRYLGHAILYRSVKIPIFQKNEFEIINYENSEDLAIGANISRFIGNGDSEYLEALKKEIKLVTNSKTKKEVVEVRLLIGDYVPENEYLSEIISILEEKFVMKNGIGIFLNISQVTRENLSNFKVLGIRNIDIEVGIFNEKIIKKLGYKTVDFEEVKNTLSQLRFQSVSMNLNFRLPNHKAEDLVSDFDRAFDIGANSIGLYQYLNNTDKYDFRLPKARAVSKTLKEVSQHCENKGYIRKSKWYFSKSSNGSSGDKHTYSLCLGVGDLTNLKGVKIQNLNDIEAYKERINNGELPTYTARFTKDREQMVEYALNEAVYLKLNKRKFEKRFDVNIEEAFRFEIFLGKILGYVVDDGTDFIMTEKWLCKYYRYIY